jgi:hypothetical protein
MTPISSTPRRIANANRGDRPRPSSVLQTRIRLMSDGVVASYIRDISARDSRAERTGTELPAPCAA